MSTRGFARNNLYAVGDPWALSARCVEPDAYLHSLIAAPRPLTPTEHAYLELAEMRAGLLEEQSK